MFAYMALVRFQGVLWCGRAIHVNFAEEETVVPRVMPRPHPQQPRVGDQIDGGGRGATHPWILVRGKGNRWLDAPHDDQYAVGPLSETEYWRQTNRR